MSEYSRLLDLERFLERRERERNEKITKVLSGRLKPPDEQIIRKLKEKRWKA